MNTRIPYSAPSTAILRFSMEVRFMVSSNPQSSGEDFEFEEE